MLTMAASPFAPLPFVTAAAAAPLPLPLPLAAAPLPACSPLAASRVPPRDPLVALWLGDPAAERGDERADFRGREHLVEAGALDVEDLAA